MKLTNCKYKNLEMLRTSRGVTVDELMKNVSGKRSKYYDWQNGGNIRVSDLIALHTFFAVSVDCILDVKPLKITE